MGSLPVLMLCYGIKVLFEIAVKNLTLQNFKIFLTKFSNLHSFALGHWAHNFLFLIS